MRATLACPPPAAGAVDSDSDSDDEGTARTDPAAPPTLTGSASGASLSDEELLMVGQLQVYT